MFLCEVVFPVGVEVSVAAYGAELEDGLGAGASGGFEPGVGGLAADYAGYFGGSTRQGTPGLSLYLRLDGGIPFGEEAPGCLPRVLRHVDEVDRDGDLYLAVSGLGIDPVDPVVGAVDQGDPVAGVVGVAALGPVEDLGHHLCGVAGDAGGQPFVAGDRAGCGACTLVVNGGRMSVQVRGAGLALKTVPTSRTPSGGCRAHSVTRLVPGSRRWMSTLMLMDLES